MHLHPSATLAAIRALLIVLTSALIPTATVAGQAASYLWSPPNAATNAGGSNNNAPFYAISSTYQQIHQPSSMGKALTLKGMALVVGWLQ